MSHLCTETDIWENRARARALLLCPRYFDILSHRLSRIHHTECKRRNISACLWPEPSEAEVPSGEAVPDEGVLVPAQVEVVQAQPSPRQPQQVRHAEALLEDVDSVTFSYIVPFISRWPDNIRDSEHRMYGVGLRFGHHKLRGRLWTSGHNLELFI